MSDRHSELVRQRALLLEHLAWIDREIAQANMAAPALPPMPPVPSVTTAPLPFSAAAPGVSAAPGPNVATNQSSVPAALAPPAIAVPGRPGVTDEVLEQYRVSPKAVHQDVRKGCLLYFIGAFVVLGIVVAILYFTISSR